MNNVSDSISQLIKKKAEGLNPYTIPQFRSQFNEGAIAGIEMTIKIMLLFDAWKHQKYEPIEDGNYVGLYRSRLTIERPFYTPFELLEKFMEENKL